MGKAFNPPVSTFLSEQDRHDWFTSGKAFSIVGVKEDAGKFGACWTYKLATTDSKTGEVDTYFLSLKRNARRDEEAAWMLDALAEDPTGVGPVKLAQFDTNQPNPAWGFVSAE